MTDPDDEVDLLIDAWARRLPETDLSALDVMSRLRRVALNLAKIRASAFATAGSRRLGVRRAGGAAAGRAAASAEPGAVDPAHQHRKRRDDQPAHQPRRPGPDRTRGESRDGRGILVKPTPEGISRVDAAMLELVRREEIELSRVSDADRGELVRVLRALMP